MWVITLFFRKIGKYRGNIFKLLHINPLISVYVLLQWLTFPPNNSDIFLMGIPNSICHQQKKFVSNQMREYAEAHEYAKAHTVHVPDSLSSIMIVQQHQFNKDLWLI